MFQRPILNVSLARDELRVAFQTANVLVEQFQNLGLLREMSGGQRNRRYAFLPYLNLFSEPEDLSPSGQPMQTTEAAHSGADMTP
jgi:hypothetical protein